MREEESCGLRIKEFPKLTNLIQAIKSLAADLTDVNRHRHMSQTRYPGFEHC